MGICLPGFQRRIISGDRLMAHRVYWIKCSCSFFVIALLLQVSVASAWNGIQPPESGPWSNSPPVNTTGVRPWGSAPKYNGYGQHRWGFPPQAVTPPAAMLPQQRVFGPRPPVVPEGHSQANVFGNPYQILGRTSAEAVPAHGYRANPWANQSARPWGARALPPSLPPNRTRSAWAHGSVAYPSLSPDMGYQRSPFYAESPW